MNSSRGIPRLVFILALGQFVFLSGCATNSFKLMQESEQRVSEQSLFSQVSQQMEVLEKRVATAQAEDVGVFAPADMRYALSSLADARKYFDQFKVEPEKINKPVSLFFGDSMGEETLSLLAKATKALDRAEENKRKSDSLLAGSDENFKWLKKFNAQISYPYAYRDLERAHEGLIGKVSNGRFASAEKMLPQLLREQNALEIMSAQRFYLKDISQRVEREGRYELNRFAALSFNGSLGALNKAKAVIAKNPRNEERILAAKKDAEFSFEVAHAVSGDMQKLVDMDKREMERWLLLLTAKLNEAGMALGANDVRDLSVLDQLEQVTNAAKGQREKLAQAETPVSSVDSVLEMGVAIGEAIGGDSNDPSTAIVSGNKELAGRVIKLEQERTSLGRQLEALSSQMDEIQAANQKLIAKDDALVKDEYVPLSQRKSLFW